MTAKSPEQLPDRDAAPAGHDGLLPDSSPPEAGGLDPSTELGTLSPRERAAVIHRIRTLVEYWGITAEELSQDDPPAALPPVSAEPLPVKYRHPSSGETWDGQGPHPQWLRDALLKEGFTVDELRRAAASQA